MGDTRKESEQGSAEQYREINEALLVSSIRQHELAEEAEAAAARLRQREAEAVAARRSAEALNAALRESEHRFREMIDMLPAAVYTTDAEGRVTHFNAAAVDLVGRTPQIGQDQWCVSWKMFRLDGSQLPHEECPMAIALKEGREVRGREAIIERPDGTRVWVAPYPTLLRDNEGKVVGAINMVMDITDRTLLENKTKEHAQVLAERDRRKDEFLAMLSHELRNPLSSIVNAMHLLRSEGGRTPFQIEAHGMIERQVAQLARLVDDLLEVSRISTGRIHLQTEGVDLGGVVRLALETTRQQAASKEQSVAKALTEKPLWVLGDPVRLEQVVVNLLNNATKYTERRGHVWVSLNEEGGEAVLRVRDDGVGMSEEMLPRIFDLFAQVDSSIERSQGGLGIGLALVRSLVTMHGGTVEARSELGRGSEFTVKLPVHLSPAASSTRPVEGAPAPDHALKVLVVDDNLDAAKSVAMLLQISGHDVRVANDATTAMRAAMEDVPEVVLLDLGLPVVSGFEVAERIRQQPTLRRVTLVALTGYGQESDRQRSRKAGFDYHLVKPVDFARIENILSHLKRSDATGRGAPVDA
jgi:PAS domain S-box-containing protein